MRTAILLALALPMTLHAQEPAKTAAATKAEKPAAATELKVGTGVESKAIVGASDRFSVPAGTKLWAWARVAGQPADAKLTLVFAKGDKEAFRKEMTAAGSPWRINANRTFRAGDEGAWTAKVLGGDGAEIASVSFQVEIQK